jgi:hypothetical protein
VDLTLRGTTIARTKVFKKIRTLDHPCATRMNKKYSSLRVGEATAGTWELSVFYRHAHRGIPPRW